MTGRMIVIGLVGFAALFGLGLWYAQFYAFYEETTAQEVEINGVAYSVADWTGIDASSSPLKLRACFQLAETPEAPLAPEPTPLVAPPWFDCFDAGAIDAALRAGEAVAYLAAREEALGVNRIVVRYPDGRAFMWRQLNERYANQ
ncbi:MAG: DUF6446 family protein [Pseudomonadota bacterium]